MDAVKALGESGVVRGLAFWPVSHLALYRFPVGHALDCFRHLARGWFVSKR